MIRDAQDQLRIQKLVEDRMKTPNERDLESFMEKNRQEMIKRKLDMYRNREKRKILMNGKMTDTHNIFKGHKNILGGKKIFTMKKVQREGGMFFKWQV